MINLVRRIEGYKIEGLGGCAATSIGDGPSLRCLVTALRSQLHISIQLARPVYSARLRKSLDVTTGSETVAEGSRNEGRLIVTPSQSLDNVCEVSSDW